MIETQKQAWLDQGDAHLAAVIRRHGWFIQYVGGDEDSPSFAYTVGLFGLGHPELLILGVPPGTAAGVLNNLGDRVRAGDDLVPGEIITFEEWPHRIVAEPVPNPGEIVFAANRYYRRRDEQSVPVLQLSYDDKAGRFPWEEGYAAPEMQPRPGTFRA
jgi:Domain of unknown function (DUF4262)